MKVKVINMPENITIYFIQRIPHQRKYKPPKVSITDKNGSIIKKSLSFLLSLVAATKMPTKKKIMAIESI